jgi:hypothetical protein
VLEKTGLRPLLKRRKNGGSEAGAARVAGAKAAVPVPDHDGPAPA